MSHFLFYSKLISLRLRYLLICFCLLQHESHKITLKMTIILHLIFLVGYFLHFCTCGFWGTNSFSFGNFLNILVLCNYRDASSWQERRGSLCAVEYKSGIWPLLQCWRNAFWNDNSSSKKNIIKTKLLIEETLPSHWRLGRQ